MENISLEEAPIDNNDLTLNDHYVSDVISVSILPEKKGSALWKHVEYEIKSQKYNSRVERRFNDFLNLYQNFLRKYSYRMIVRLPPKQIMLDAFVEERRRNLQRWLILISQHPILSRDDMLKVFLTTELHQEMTNSVEIESEHVLTRNYEFKVVLEKQQAARKVLNQIIKIKRLVDLQFKRQLESADDFESLSQALTNVAQESDSTLSDYSEGFHKISMNYNKSSREQQQVSVIERFELIVEIFTAFCDLTERVIDENQKTPTSSANQWQRLQNAIKIKGNTYEANDDDAREKFSVHCVLEEFNFALKYLKLLPSILMKFSLEQCEIYNNFAKFLSDIVNAESDKLENEAVKN